MKPSVVKFGGSNLRRPSDIDRVVAAFGIKNQVSPDGIFNSQFLPASSERRL